MCFLTETKILYFHYSIKLKWWICECHQLLLLMTSILKQRESYRIFISVKKTPALKTPQHYRYQDLMEYFLYEMVKIRWEKKNFPKNIKFLISSTSSCSSWVEPEQSCFAVEQILLQHCILLEIFFFLESEPMAFSELERLFPVLIKAADKPFSVFESVWVCPSSFFALYTLRHKLTDFYFFYQLLRWLARDM